MAWRLSCQHAPTELDIYKKLYEKGVGYIAQVIGGGDVFRREDNPVKLKTRSQDLLQHRGDRGQNREWCQSRLIIETLGVPLGEYTDSLAMIWAVYQAFLGTSAAGIA